MVFLLDRGAVGLPRKRAKYAASGWRPVITTAPALAISTFSDVSVAIGEKLHAASGKDDHAPSELLSEMIAAGTLGRKSGSGFYQY